MRQFPIKDKQHLTFFWLNSFIVSFANFNEFCKFRQRKKSWRDNHPQEKVADRSIKIYIISTAFGNAHKLFFNRFRQL